MAAQLFCKAQWFCKIMGDEQGPMTAAELQEIARNGRLGIDDLVRKAEQTTWVRAENVVGLYDGASLPVVVKESIAVIDDATLRETWGATASLSGANDTKCSIEINASALSRSSMSSTAAGGTTSDPSRDTAARISNVIVPRRTLKMTTSSRPKPINRNFGNRTTRAMNFDSEADTVNCAEVAQNEDQCKTLQSLPGPPASEDSVAVEKLAEQCV